MVDIALSRYHHRPVRVLGIETSTRRGSVALVEGTKVLCVQSHEEPNKHAERVLGLVDRALAEAKLSRQDLDRVAVGVGPGSFTGLRVGIALAEGMALGLERPLVGVGSLRAMAHAVPAADERVRIAVLDARRSEVFVAAYAPDGEELVAPNALAPEAALTLLREKLGGRRAVTVGEGAKLLGDGFEHLTGSEFDLPHAVAVAALGVVLEPAAARAEPVYVRGPGATLPNLPPSPLG
jgi:tRNA threonylcarbamoyladenosine biosynthesis protein TsaB